MRIDLNIIKIILISLLLVSNVSASWYTLCQFFNCKGCEDIEQDIKDAAQEIDDEEEEGLEKDVKKKYEEKIIIILNNPPKKNQKIPLEEKGITQIQQGITKSVARIAAMEYQANIDAKELIFLLKQNKDLYTMPQGTVK